MQGLMQCSAYTLVHYSVAKRCIVAGDGSLLLLTYGARGIRNWSHCTLYDTTCIALRIILYCILTCQCTQVKHLQLVAALYWIEQVSTALCVTQDLYPIAHCKVHSAKCSLHTAHCTLHTAHCSLLTVRCTLYTAVHSA